MSLKVYLGGPINNQTVDQAGTWRDQFAETFSHMGFIPVDPFDKQVREKLKAHGAQDNLDQVAEQLGLANASQIVAGSLSMVDACDIIVLNFLDVKKYGTISIGTPIELVFATLCQTMRGMQPKHVVVLANDLQSSFFTLAHAVFDNEEDLFAHLTGMRKLMVA